MEDFHTRLKSLKNGYSDAEFARMCGIKYTTLKGYLDGKTPGLDNAARIAKAFDTSLDWLYGGGVEHWEGEDGSVTMMKAHSKDIISIPRYEVQAAAGNGSEVLSQEVSDYFMVSKDWFSRFVPNGAKLGMIEARGDSMEPTIHNGDGLIVDFNISKIDVNQGGVFIISTMDGVKVKRLQMMMDGRIRVSSDNPNYDPEIIEKEFADEHLTIHSKVILGIGPLRLR